MVSLNSSDGGYRRVRILRGMASTASLAATPLGGWWLYGLKRLAAPERRERGLAIVLPGIEGRSVVNWNIARGLAEGGWPGAVEIHDWTTGFWPLFAYHLRARRRNRRAANRLAEAVVQYQEEFPGRPVYLVGHSGGGALAVWAAEALPENRAIRGAVLLAPALSSAYPLGPALQKLERGLWNFWSRLDLLFLAAGTLALGTFDGRHAVSAGFRGFLTAAASAEERELYSARLRQVPYAPSMAARFNLGGHVGCCNRVFVAESIAPLLAT